MINPLLHACDAYVHLLEVEEQMMRAIKGEAAFEPEFDQALADSCSELVAKSVEACEQLSERAQRARLNAIWKQFVEEQKNLVKKA